MEKVTITEKDILNANASIPSVLKYTLARYIAEISVDKKQITVKEGGVDSIPLPDLFQRNTLRENQFKVGVFVKEYMGKTFDPVLSTEEKPIPYLMAADETDAWNNFESQLDRLKRSKDKAIADKCYDILNDYHAFCRMVSIEIEQELQIRNDVLGRAAWLLSLLVKKFDVEELKENIKDIAKAVEEATEEPTEQEA